MALISILFGNYRNIDTRTHRETEINDMLLFMMNLLRWVLLLVIVVAWYRAFVSRNMFFLVSIWLLPLPLPLCNARRTKNKAHLSLMIAKYHAWNTKINCQLDKCAFFVLIWSYIPEKCLILFNHNLSSSNWSSRIGYWMRAVHLFA